MKENSYWKQIIIIFVVALIMRGAALASFKSSASLIYVNDSLTYLQVAKNIITHGVYSMEISPTPHPDNFRTPLYPLFLLPFVYFKTSLYAPVIVQILIASLGMALIYVLAKKVTSPKIAFIATLLAALEPFSALIGSQILTEAIFTALFLPAILMLCRHLKTGQTRHLIISGVLLALAALARPIAWPFGVIIPLAAVLRPGDLAERFKRAVIGSITFLLFLSPWLWFMASKVHTFNFSSVSAMQVYAYHGRYFDNWRAATGRSLGPDDRLPTMDLNAVNETFDARAIAPLKIVGSAYLKNHLPQYIWYHFTRWPRLFTDSGYASILNGLPFIHFNYDSAAGGFLDQLNSQTVGSARIAIRQQPFFLTLLIADLGFVIIALLALTNILVYYRCQRRWSRERILLFIIIIFYSLIASPIGGARFRIPLNPLLFLLGLETLYLLKKHSSVIASPPQSSQTSPTNG